MSEDGWVKSSICTATATCVEIKFTKSSFSAGGQCCVEVHQDPEGGVFVRDSKNPDGPQLWFTADEWAAFIAGVKNGEFN